jgi:2-polyprenyl-6-methoxyphenol hydroxylase-like FAD-dependent oxidoreductase
MRAHFPDVYSNMLDRGGQEMDLRPKLPGQPVPEDEELAYVGIRRPLIEWALREAVLTQTGIEIKDNVRVAGLLGDGGRVTGVLTDKGDLTADLVVDATGRSSPAPEWLAAIGAAGPRIASNECGVVYYSRYYRLRDGETPPDGPWIPTPRAMLPYAAFSSFPGDNRTFAAVLAIPPQDRDLRVLRFDRAYQAAISLLPALYSWTSLADPITDVLPMGNLQNSFRHYLDDSHLAVQGFVPVGDALCHTNPMFALGLSQSVIHAVTLARSISEQSDVDAAVTAYHRAVEPEAEERYELISACDDARCRFWRGEQVDFAHRAGAYQLFALAAGSAAAFSDPDVFRAVVRRIGFLDRTAVLDEKVALQDKIENIFAELMAKPRPPAGPSREDLLRVVNEAGA